MALSLAATALFTLARLPAALLLGPMVAGILLETGGGSIKIRQIFFLFAQAVIGCMIARVISAQTLLSIGRQWPLFIGVVLVIIAASNAMGFVVSRLKILPDTTAVWGMLPGAASVMMVMAEAFGADLRLVAFMQYFRVVLVATMASLVARFWVHVSGAAEPTLWFPPIHGAGFVTSLILVGAGIATGRFTKIPAGAILAPFFIGSILQVSGVVALDLPPWLLAAAYACMGWSIGLRFTRSILLHVLRILPKVTLSIVLLMVICGALAVFLVLVMDIDPLTAYLATSPGGMSSVAIIAASSRADMPFVMSLQCVRFLMILLIGPPLSRWVAQRVEKKVASPNT